MHHGYRIFFFYCFVVTFTPGPTNIVILSTVHHHGSKKAIEYTYGATIAFGVLLTLSTLLNSMLIIVIPKILIGMQIIGTIYMLYLAYQIYKMDGAGSADDKTGTFANGFLMQFLNPKVVLFALTVIPSFVLPFYTDVSAVTISVLVITVIGFAAFISWQAHDGMAHDENGLDYVMLYIDSDMMLEASDRKDIVLFKDPIVYEKRLRQSIVNLATAILTEKDEALKTNLFRCW